MKKLLSAVALAAVVSAAAPARAEVNLSVAPTFEKLSLQLSLGQAAEVKKTAERETTLFGLPKNVGPVDRVFRGVVAAGLIGLGAWGFSSDSGPNDTWSAALMGVAAVPAATGAIGYCPLYHLLGIDNTF